MKNVLLSFCCLLISLITVAQQPGGHNRPGGNQNMNIGHLYGKVVDTKTNKGIAGATVQLVGTRFEMPQPRDTVLKHDSTFRKFDSVSLKPDSAFRRFDTAFRRDTAFNKLDTVGHYFDTSGQHADTTHQKFNKTSQKPREVILATVLAEANGDFSLENLPVFGN